MGAEELLELVALAASGPAVGMPATACVLLAELCNAPLSERRKGVTDRLGINTEHPDTGLAEPDERPHAHAGDQDHVRVVRHERVDRGEAVPAVRRVLDEGHFVGPVLRQVDEREAVTVPEVLGTSRIDPARGIGRNGYADGVRGRCHAEISKLRVSAEHTAVLTNHPHRTGEARSSA